ncbi:MAG: phytoene desaturase family protein [Planctomycetota bacterium]|jgi:phytoene dehydrogenase-like protein
MRYDALILGAGMSGLAAGIRLAHFGKRVAILERHYLWGGLNSFYKLGGRRFDTGLHALTNFVPRGVRGTPLPRILRQLRIPREALRLGEQEFSEIAFRTGDDKVRLRFSNDLELLRGEIERAFPAQLAGFDRLCAELPGYDDFGRVQGSARAELAKRVSDPLLCEMLLHPVSCYGAATEDDMPWDQYGALFRSIFLEGFARPEGGIKTILDLLVGRFRESGGELRMRSGVARIVVDGDAARGVVLDDGTELEAEQVFSSAGLCETRRLCDLPGEERRDAGRLSFMETIAVTERPPADLGCRAAVTFFNHGPELAWRRPDELVSTTSGVVCCPTNYASSEVQTEGAMRATVLANHELWTALSEDDYRAAKEREGERLLDAALHFVPDPRPHSVFRDTFTPRTIERFTGHLNGAVYGSPNKRGDGSIGLENVFLIGTDQGPVGIIGALVSGINMANRYGLSPAGVQGAGA